MNILWNKIMINSKMAILVMMILIMKVIKFTMIKNNMNIDIIINHELYHLIIVLVINY